MDVAVVRYGEISLKSDRVRKYMEKTLMKNIEAQTGGKAFKRASRIEVVGGNWEILSKVFGVVSWSPAKVVRADIDEIKEAALEIVKGSGASTFSVRAQRVTKDFPLTSPEINKIVGAFIVKNTGMKVDLEEPDIEVGIEIVGKKAYIFKERIKGPGGLPYGVEGKVLVLFSGGIDSPVSAWMMGRRGAEVGLYHMHVGVDISGVYNKLSEWFPYRPVLIVDSFPFDKVHNMLLRKNLTSYYYVLFKAIIYRRAEEIAEEKGYISIVTGESIGQVSSQTLHNISVLDRIVNITVLRPLIGLNKNEIIDYAKYIGTYEESIKLGEPCAEIKYKPVTKADPNILAELLEEVEE